MATIIADSGGFIASLDLRANYDAPLGDDNVSINRFPAAYANTIFYAPKRFGPQDQHPTTANASIEAYGYSVPEGPVTEDGLRAATFFGNSGHVALSSLLYGETTFTIKEAYFTDYITPIEFAGPYLPPYVPSIGAIGDLQGAINSRPLTFIGSDTATDIIRVAGGALTQDDFLYGNGGNDILEGGAGFDRIYGGVGNDVLDGGTENDRLFGGNETDQLFGGAGNDILDGGLGGDRMSGGTGNDDYIVDNIYDAVLEFSGQGLDTVFSSISYSAPGPVENITLTGGASINATGNDLKNEIVGNRVANILSGGGNDDVLDGKGGADTLIGGAGQDTFVFLRGEASGDAILDFTGYGKYFGDKIVFEGYRPGAHLDKVGAETYEIVDVDSVETITIKGVLDASDYLFA